MLDKTQHIQTEPGPQPHASYRPRALSQVLAQLAERQSGDVSVRCIRNALADRSFATFLVFTAAINMLPFPPGSTLILGVPIILVALQMVAGRQAVWLPETFLRRSVSQDRFARMTGRLIPLLQRLEGWVRPRHWPFSDHRRAERIVGAFALVLGLAVTLPVPFSNWFPAFACALCGLALSERDGLWLTIGILTGLFSLLVVFGLLFTVGTLAMHWMGG